MKVKTPSLMKKIMAAFSSKTNELRIRLMIFFLLHKNLDKTSLTNSLQALVSHHPHHHQKKKNDDVIDEKEEEEELVENRVDDEKEEEDHQGRKGSLLMSYNKATTMMGSDTHDIRAIEDMPRKCKAKYDDERQRTVDLTHALFKESEAEMQKEGEAEEAVVEGVVEEEEEVGEEDIDQAADLFIQRFKKQMLLQKQRSLERQQWLLLSNA